MSLRARLVVSLGLVLAVAFLVAGFLIVNLVRTSLVARLDDQLAAVGTNPKGLPQVAQLVGVDAVTGRRLALMRLDKQGHVVESMPSGFATDPDPLPVLPVYQDGIPAAAYGHVTEVSSVDGAVRYRVLILQGAGPKGIVLAVAAPLSGVDSTTQTLVRTLVVVGGAAVLLLLVVAWVVIRQGLLPLERIAVTAEQIAGGNLSPRAGLAHDGTEVGRLGTAFDAMLDQIQASYAEQQAALDAKTRSEEQLRRFVADASHELRTPLTVLRGYAELHHAGGLADPAAVDVAMRRIGTESRRMGTLVDDLLLLARLDQGRPIRSDPVDLSRIADDAVADARAVEPGRPAGGTIEPGIIVTGDEDRLRQVIGNLVANVRVHTPPGTPFEVTVSRHDAVAEVRVVDHGPGVGEVHQDGVFDRFYRADPGRARDSGGTGLGLSIAQSLVQAHGGTITLADTPGGGATFVVTLPLTASSQPVPGSTPANGPTI